jgi:ankyrin repeat protein
MTATADATRPRLTTSTVATARNRLDDVDTAGDTALCLAAKNGHAHVVEELAKVSSVHRVDD